MAHIRVYLEKKNKSELVALLLDLVQGMDEPYHRLALVLVG